MANEYGCLMARFPEPYSSTIRELGESIPDRFLYDDGSDEYGREDSPHVTLKFGLHTSDPEEVKEKLSFWHPLHATIGEMSVFRGDDFIVLKLGMEGPDLFRVHRYLSETFENTEKWPVYKPHATIAYLVKDKFYPCYYKKLYRNDLVGARIVFDTVEFSSPEDTHHFFRLTGTRMTAASKELLTIAKEIRHGRKDNQ